MTNNRQRHVPSPYMQMRPATMLTALGLCAIVVLMQFVPEIQNAARAPAATLTLSR